MIFNTAAYALFFTVVFLAHWTVARRGRPRVLLLLVASYVFYAHWSWRFLGLILFSTVLDHQVGLALSRASLPARRRLLLGLSLAGNLGVLGFFKYYDFFARETTELAARLGLTLDVPTLELVLPVGISFYTFQTLSYTIDVYRGRLEAERDPLRFALFVAFFPQLVAGPIVRAVAFLPQIGAAPSLDRARLDSGLRLIVWGLVKKVLIADVLGAGLVDPFWEQPGDYGGLASLLAVYGYAFQIYGDFSGYSDIAIGSARLLGFELGVNFDAPYRTTTPREFWSRWHISLSSWLRDYLYIPLGGNRRGTLRTALNLMLTMLLGGLWHGASWMFVGWGAFHGLLLMVDRMLGLQTPSSAAGRWAARLGCFQLACLGWILFRSADGSAALAVLTSLGQASGGAEIGPGAAAALLLAVITHLPPRAFKERLADGFARSPAVLQGAAYALVIGGVMSASSSQRPFLYFQF